MINRRYVYPVAALLALASIGACSKTTTTTTTTPAPSSSASVSAAAARPFTAAMVAEGDSIYHARGCRNCHGMDAKGAANGPNLTTGKFMHIDGTYDSFVHIITTGVPKAEIKDSSHPNAMPPMGGTRPAPLTPDQVKSVAAYVYTLSHP